MLGIKNLIEYGIKIIDIDSVNKVFRFVLRKYFVQLVDLFDSLEGMKLYLGFFEFLIYLI